MFIYYSRIFDKYGKPISAYAILTGPAFKARPNKYIAEFIGTKLEYSYNVYQISQQSESELLKSYIHFENTDNDSIFDKNLKQITGRTETMGLVEQVLAEREECGLERGRMEIVTNMLRNDFSDEMIVKATAVTPDYVQKIRNSLKFDH